MRVGLTPIRRAAIGVIASLGTGPLFSARRTVLIAAVLLFPNSISASIRASGTDLHYRVWTTEEGLPQGSVRAIAQTPDGYIWIATLDGLVRFDGVRMTVFAKSDVPDMTSNRCVSLLVDRRGTLWVGTEDGGILQKQGARFRSFGRASGLESEAIGVLSEDSDGRIWASTQGGHAVFDGDRWRRADPTRRFPSLSPIPQGVPLPEIPANTRRHQGNQPSTVGAGGRVWLLDGGYLHRLENGVWRTLANPVPATALPMPSSLFEDREGNLWIGSEQGLVQASLSAVRALVPPVVGDAANVYTLAEDRAGRVWVGTQSETLLWAPRAGFVSPAGGHWWARHWMTALEPDHDGSLLAGNPSGLFRILPEGRIEKLGNHAAPRDFLRDRRGVLWIATEAGLLRQSSTGLERIYAVPSPDVRVLLEARDGTLWVGTYGGLVHLSGANVQTFTTADGLSSDRIRFLHEDETGALWIGTYDGGLNRFANGKFVAIRKRDGLYDDGVFVILDGGDGRYYMCSNRGIHAVAKRELDAFVSGAAPQVTHRAWRSVDGMPSSECNGGRQPSGLRASDGTLWFPTQRGIAIIDPRAVLDNPVPPPVVVEAVTTERRTIPLTDAIVLAPGERRLEVRYTANTFIRPEGARFRHRLVGVDPDWVDAGTRRFAQYSYVPPGDYVLRILAANSDGVWSPEGVSLPIRVDPYWWQTLWFRGAAALLAVTALAGVYQQRIASLKRRRTEQETFSRRLLESQEAERKRIASELHDGIGQTLVVIRNRALLGLRDNDNPAVARQITEISDVAGQAIDEVRKVAHGLRPYQIDRLGLKRALETLVEHTAASSGVAIASEIGNLDGALAKEDEINVYRIVQESLSNIVRHAHAKSGHVAAVVREHEIEIRIDDDGAGFDAATLSQNGGGLGLTGIAERARILGGSSAVRSSSGQGTGVLVRFPRRDRSQAQ